jgi:hypothetical protein
MLNLEHLAATLLAALQGDAAHRNTSSLEAVLQAMLNYIELLLQTRATPHPVGP